MRILVDVEDEEIDLVYGEGCLELLTGAKLDNDKGQRKFFEIRKRNLNRIK